MIKSFDSDSHVWTTVTIKGLVNEQSVSIFIVITVSTSVVQFQYMFDRRLLHLQKSVLGSKVCPSENTFQKRSTSVWLLRF